MCNSIVENTVLFCEFKILYLVFVNAGLNHSG